MVAGKFGEERRGQAALIINDDISLIQFVIPGLTKPAPYLIRGNPSF